MSVAAGAALLASLALPWSVVTTSAGTFVSGAPLILGLGLHSAALLVPAALLAVAALVSPGAVRIAAALTAIVWASSTLGMLALPDLGGSPFSSHAPGPGYTALCISLLLFGFALIAAARRDARATPD